jgi:hypothetical protein
MLKTQLIIRIVVLVAFAVVYAANVYLRFAYFA